MATCRGCGKGIIWATIQNNNKKIPLDPRPSVYEYDQTSGECMQSSPAFMVSHFATCPKANDFSASKKHETPST